MNLLERDALGSGSESVADFEHRIVRRDGETRNILVRTRTVKDDSGRIVRRYGASQDITERKTAETELARVNRALRMLGGSNQALIHFTDEASLLDEVCRIAVEVGGYRMAWAGLTEGAEAETIRPVAQAGFETGYLEAAHFRWNESETGPKPGRTAILSGQRHIVHDVSTDRLLLPPAKKRSSAATGRSSSCHSSPGTGRSGYWPFMRRRPARSTRKRSKY